MNKLLISLPERHSVQAMVINLATWPAFTCLIASLLFIFDIYTPLFCMTLSCAAAAGAGYYFVRCRRSAGFGFLGFITIIVVIALIAGLILDTSYDGQQYQAEAVLQLSNGFNPLREIIAPDVWDISWAVWLNALPKMPWLVETQVYGLFSTINHAKILSFYIMATSFFSLLVLLCALNLDARIVWVGAVIGALNPVSVSQSISAYTDGFAGGWVLLAAISLIVLYRRRMEKIAIFLFLIFLSNAVLSKFSQLFPAMILGIIFWILMWRRTDWDRSFKLPIIFCVAVLIAGINPYLTNIVRYGNLAYPMVATNYLKGLGLGYDNKLGVGEGFADFIYTQHAPVNFHDVPAPLQGIASIFATSAHANIKYPAEFKFYPEISVEELKYLTNPDGRVGGFGPLFNVILVMSIIVITASYRLPIFPAVLVVTAAIGVAFLVTPFNWWARYVSYLWILPLLALIGIADHTRVKLKKTIVTVLIAACLINSVGIAAFVIRKAVLETRKFNKQIALATFQDPYKLELAFGSKRVDLAQANVPFISPEIEGRYYVEHIAPHLTEDETKLFEKCYEFSQQLSSQPPFSWQTYSGQSISMFNNFGVLKLRDACDKHMLAHATMRIVVLPYKTESIW